VIKIGFCSVPGSGKSTLARALAEKCRRLDSKLKNVELVQEYVRQYISKYGIPENVWEQIRIFNKQLSWENSAINDKTELLITDSPIFLQFAYATELVDWNDKKSALAYRDLFKMLCEVNSPPRYDILFYLKPRKEIIDDGIRAKSHISDETWQKNMDMKLKIIFNDMFKSKKIIELNDNLSIEEYVEVAIKVINYTIEFNNNRSN